MKSVAVALSMLLLAGCTGELPAQTSDLIALARGHVSTQVRLPRLVDSYHVERSALSEAEATAIAAEVERVLLNDEMPRLSGVSVDLSFREAFRAEIASALTSPELATRLAMARYIRRPRDINALRPYAADETFVGLRRSAILVHPLAPTLAIDAYMRADALTPDAFCRLQASDLHRQLGSGAIARNLVTVVRERWPDDPRIQAIALVKDAFLDGDVGLYEQRRQKLTQALAINLRIERLDGAASNLIDLADVNFPVSRDGEVYRGPNAMETAPQLEQAIAFARLSGADSLVGLAAQARANLADLGGPLGGAEAAERFRAEAFAAWRRARHYDRAIALARQSTHAALAARSFEAAHLHIAAIERIGFDQGDASAVLDARLLAAEQARTMGEPEAAERALNRSVIIARLSPLGDARLAYHRGLIGLAREDARYACAHFRDARRAYAGAGHSEGVAFMDAHLRTSCSEMNLATRPWWAAIVQPLIWGLSMSLVMGWLANSRLKRRPNTDRGRLRLPLSILIIGLVFFALFATLAVLSIVFPNSTGAWWIVGVLAGLSLLGLLMAWSYFVDRHEISERHIRYATILGYRKTIRWEDVMSLRYDPTFKWLRVESRTGDIARLSIMLMGLPEFAALALARAPQGSIDQGTEALLRETAEGILPPF